MRVVVWVSILSAIWAGEAGRGRLRARARAERGVRVRTVVVEGGSESDLVDVRQHVVSFGRGHEGQRSRCFVEEGAHGIWRARNGEIHTAAALTPHALL